MKNIQSVRGMKDYLPDNVLIWQQVENILKNILNSYGYKEIRLPIIEHVALYNRTIGEVTDLVEKEMYNFTDRNGDSLVLRPEGTAGCVRSSIEHGLIYNQEQRLWYMGPMFRHERPQCGRYRQFHQIGVEVFGLEGPDIDVELIMINIRLWKALGLDKYIRLEINSLGSLDSCNNYRKVLIGFLEKHKNLLDENCKRRMYTNPMRVLDSKNPNIKCLMEYAPKISNYIDNDSRTHFKELCNLLDKLNISYKVNHHLVRGLDYYNRTVIEWISDFLGAQGTVCGGGRYDDLVKQLSSYSTPAIGFAIGMERLVLLVETLNPNFKLRNRCNFDVHIITKSKDIKVIALDLTEKLRDAMPEFTFITTFRDSSVKKQITRAIKKGATIILILGENASNLNQVTIKDLRNGKQQTISILDILSTLKFLLK
ncbi:histidine--tRNA ligase [Candidatus Pantoea edessiphila]|uniref:Histidine--tRNA ligase n=1 Tax=Candidatus Pantoea edessiphila TaxID=2044610 RepID=A0A2P5SZ41_9GAMM|nr:histidine--tRNA ligase [Candidatus Pantoea edessiphila]MBK4775515.1 histidine--tRNA ligase [Pantoea sp. Edef]PPI87604.1 histidine--tRNA ligase [Candidatus Pantoea edessiphila]